MSTLARSLFVAGAAALLAGAALAQAKAPEAEAVMRDYFKLWNAGDAAAISSRIYKFDNAANPMQTKEGLQASFKSLKDRGYSHSELYNVDSCLAAPDLALAELKFSRLKTDGTFLAKDLTTYYTLRKLPEGWRIAVMGGGISKLDCSLLKAK
jgi:ketosteroid isomerase-like protein